MVNDRVCEEIPDAQRHGNQMDDWIPAKSDVEANRAVCIVAYVGLCWVAPLLEVKGSPFTRFHVNQAILVTITSTVIQVVKCIVLSICSVRLNTLQMIGLETFLSTITAGLSFAMMLYGMINAGLGKEKEIPIIGSFSILKGV